MDILSYLHNTSNTQYISKSHNTHNTRNNDDGCIIEKIFNEIINNNEQILVNLNKLSQDEQKYIFEYLSNDNNNNNNNNSRINDKVLVIRGYCYLNGYFTCIDITKAVDSYKLAADHGNSFALNVLGNYYENGEIVKQDYKIAFECYQKAADHNNADGMYNLARCYDYGIHVETNKEYAFKLYTDAATLRHKLAMHNAAMCYYLGNGVKIDHVKAYEKLQYGALIGNDLSNNFLTTHEGANLRIHYMIKSIHV